MRFQTSNDKTWYAPKLNFYINIGNLIGAGKLFVFAYVFILKLKRTGEASKCNHFGTERETDNHTNRVYRHVSQIGLKRLS